MSDHSEMHRDLGALTAEVRQLREQMSEFRSEMKEVQTALNQARGGWKTIAALSGITGGVAGFLATVVKIKAVTG